MQLQLRVPSARAQLPELVAALDAALVRAGVPAAVLADAHVITEEIVCNTIDYGCPPEGEHEIRIDIALADDRLVLEFRDNGCAHDPLHQPAPDLEADIADRPIGGLGVHLVRALSESVDYTRTPTHNILRVVLRTA